MLTEDDGVLPLMSLQEGDVVDAEDAALADRYEIAVGKLWKAYLAQAELKQKANIDELASIAAMAQKIRGTCCDLWKRGHREGCPGKNPAPDPIHDSMFTRFEQLDTLLGRLYEEIPFQHPSRRLARDARALAAMIRKDVVK